MKGENIKSCTTCKQSKPLTDFHYKSSKKLARRPTCKDCDKAYKNKPKYKWQQKNYDQKRRSDPALKNKMMQQCRDYGQTVRGRANRLFLAARQRAGIHNLEFSITQTMIEVMLHMGVCQRTGIPFDFSPPVKTNYNPYAPSLDRKNPYEGYTFENTQVVCNAYNLAKNQMNDLQFIEFCKIVVEKSK